LNIGDEDLQYWGNLSNMRYPYDHTSFFDTGRTVIGTVLSKEGRVQPSDKVLYSVMYSNDGVIQQDVAATKLDGFVRGMKMRENTSIIADNHIGKVPASSN